MDWFRKSAAQGNDNAKAELVIAKLHAIIIDECDFRQANIVDIVAYLNNRSLVCDKTTEVKSEKGVHIVLELEKKVAFSLEVTFSARFVSLYNVLNIITQVSGLEWRVVGSVVYIRPKGHPVLQAKIGVE
jgi:hypothetical protein